MNINNIYEHLFDKDIKLERILGKNKIKQELLEQLKEYNLNLIEQIYKDDLTGLENQKFYLKFLTPDSNFNRRKEDFKLLNKFISYLKENKIDTIMFIDMANFKSINDLINHTVGDNILKLVGKTIKFNNIPISIRRSGDEYILLGTKRQIEELKQQFESEKFNNRLKKMIQKNYGKKEYPYNVFVGMGIKNFNLDFINYIKSKEDIDNYSIFMEKEILLSELELDEYKSIKKNNKNKSLLINIFKNINNIIKDSFNIKNNDYRPILK